MENYMVARTFWESRDKYPDYPNTLQRRLIDTNIIAPIAYKYDSVFDMGCGDGSMLLSLREFTNISIFQGCDLSHHMVDRLNNKWGWYPGLSVFVGDVLSGNRKYTTDIFLSLGVFPYIFYDKDIIDILDRIGSETIIVRSPCTLKKEDETINKYSDDLKANYAAIYRTVDNYIKILSSRFKVRDCFRAYPDDIESKYGTKHFFFICDNN
jgi:trans-aconitate methyltransferase